MSLHFTKKAVTESAAYTYPMWRCQIVGWKLGFSRSILTAIAYATNN